MGKYSKHTEESRLQGLHSAIKRNDIKFLVQFIKKYKESNRNGLKSSVVNTKRGYSSDDGGVEAVTRKKAYFMQERFKNGYSLLHLVASYNRKEMVELLVKEGACVDDKAFNCVTPLHVACKLGHAEITILLLNLGANINACTKDRLTALHCASRNGHTSVMKVLLQRGAHLDSRTKSQLTCLHLSCQGNHVKSVEYLLDRCRQEANDALLEALSLDLLTALHVACHCGSLQAAEALLQARCDVSPKARNGFTPLHIAVKKGHSKVVELLLRHNCSLEATTESGLTALHMACYLGQIDIVKMLVSSDACVECRDEKGETPLHFSVRGNQPEVLSYLLTCGVNVDATSKNNQTCLHLSCKQASDQLTKILLEHGANPNIATTNDALTPLHIASSLGEASLVSMLVEKGGDIYRLTKKGLNCLLLATKYNRLEVMKELIRKGCDVNTTGTNNLCAVHLAVHYNKPEAFELLCKKAASLQIRTQNGYSALHVAACRGRVRMAQELLKTGQFDVDVQSENGFTPLHLASRHGHDQMASFLLSNRANANHSAFNGLTPTHLTAQEGHVKVAAILHNNGAVLDRKTNAGYTPLHTACHFGQLAMVKWLLHHSSDPDIQNKHGYSPLHQACQQGHALVVDSLLEHNANPNILSAYGESAIQVAIKFGHGEILEILRKVTKKNVQEMPVKVDSRQAIHSPEVMKEADFFDTDDTYARICADGSSRGSLRSLGGVPNSLRKHSACELDSQHETSQGCKRTKRKESDGGDSVDSCLKISYKQQRSIFQVLDMQQQTIKKEMMERQQNQMMQHEIYENRLPAQKASQLQIPANSKQCNSPLQLEEQPPSLPQKTKIRQQNRQIMKLTSEKLQQQQHYLQKRLLQQQQHLPNFSETSKKCNLHYQAFDSVTEISDTTSTVENFLEDKDFHSTTSVSLSSPPSTFEHPLLKKFTIPIQLQKTNDDINSKIVSKPPLKTGSRPRTCSARSQDREGRPKHLQNRMLKTKVSSETNLHAPKNLRCHLLHPAQLNPSLFPHSTPLPPLSHGQDIATWIVQCHPPGMTFSSPIVIEVPFVASLKRGEMELLTLRCSDGLNWREHLSPPLKGLPITLLRPTFKGVKLDHPLYKEQRTHIVTASLPWYFALIIRPQQVESELCSPGLSLQLPTLPICLKVGPHPSNHRLPFLSLSAQPVSASLLQACCQSFLCSPLVTVTPFNQTFSSPVVLSLSDDLLSKNLPESIVSSHLEDFVFLYHLSPGTGWAEMTGKIKLYKDDSNANILFVLKQGGSYLLANSPLKEYTLSYMHKCLNRVFYQAEFVFYVTENDSENLLHDLKGIKLKISCGTSEAIASQEDLCGWNEVFRVSNVQIQNETFQVCEIKGAIFNTPDSKDLRKLFFKAFTKHSAIFTLTVTGLQKQELSIFSFKEHLSNHTLTLSSITYNINKVPCKKPLFHEVMEPQASKASIEKIQLIPIEIYSKKENIVENNIISKKIEMEEACQKITKETKISTEKVEGTPYKKLYVEESIEKLPDNLVSKKKTLTTKDIIPIVQKHFHNSQLQNIDKSEKLTKLVTEEYSILVPNTYIEPDPSLYDVRFTYEFDKQKSEKNDVESIKGHLKMFLKIESSVDADSSNNKKQFETIAEGPFFGSLEREVIKETLVGGKLIKKEIMTTLIKKPIYKLIKSSPGIQKRLLMKENCIVSNVIENIFEMPQDKKDFDNFHFVSSLEHFKETLEDGTIRNVKLVTTRMVDNNSSRSEKPMKKLITCPEELHFEVTGIGRYNQDKERIENHKVIIIKHIVPCLELTYKIDDLPEISVQMNETAREVFDVFVSLDCGYIEPYAENCELTIDVNDEPTQTKTCENNDSENIYDNVQLLKLSESETVQRIKKVCFTAKIKPPRFVQKLLEGTIQVKNSEEEFTLKSENGSSVKIVKILTSQFFKPITMLTECDGKLMKSKKVEKLVKTMIKENILEMPHIGLDPLNCQIKVEVSNSEEQQLDSGLVKKVSTKVLLKNSQETCSSKSLNEAEANSQVDTKGYTVKDDVLTEYATFNTKSLEGDHCQHKVKTTTYIKKYFKETQGVSIQSAPPEMMKVMKQVVKEEVFMHPCGITDLGARNVDFSVSDKWLEGKTPCGAPMKKHLVMVKAFIKASGGVENNAETEANEKLIEEIEGATQVETTETENEKTINDVRFKQKVVTTKYIRPITTLKRQGAGRMPEVSTREDLLKVEINEYLFELDMGVHDSTKCESTVESYNYIKYMSNGVPLNTEVTKITARLKKNVEKELVESDVTKTQLKEKETNAKEKRLSKIAEEARSHQSVVESVNDSVEEKPIEQAVCPFNSLLAELDVKNAKQKVCTTENFQQLKNGDFIKSKITTNSFFQVDKVSVLNGSSFVEKMVKRDVSEVDVHFPNTKIESFGLNCHTVLKAKKIKSLKDSGEEFDKISIQFMIELKSKLTDDKYTSMRTDNLFLPINPCYELGESWSRQMVELEVLKTDQNTKHFIKRTTKYTSRPLYLREDLPERKLPNDSEASKILVDVCIEEIDVVEAIYEVKTKQTNCLSSEDLVIVSNEYEEHFDNGCAHRKRKLRIRSRSSEVCVDEDHLCKNEKATEYHTKVSDRGDEFNSNGSLKRWLLVEFVSVIPRITVDLSADLFYADVKVKYEEVGRKQYLFELLLCVCDLYMEHNFKVDIEVDKELEGHTNENNHSVKVHLLKKDNGNFADNKSYVRGKEQKKVREEEKEALLFDGSLVKWKTVTREVFLPVVESSLGTSDVIQMFLVKIELYVIVVEVRGNEIVVDENTRNNDYTGIFKEYESIYSLDAIPIEKVLIKYIIDPSKGIDERHDQVECHDSLKKTRTVEIDEEFLENKTKVYKQVVKCLALRPYYEISESKNPMLKEEVVSEEVEEAWVTVEDGVDLSFEVPNQCVVEHERIKIKNDEKRSTVVNNIRISKKPQHAVFEDYEASKEANKGFISGSMECEDKCYETLQSGKLGFVKNKEWKKEFFIPMIAVKCPRSQNSPEINSNKNVIFSQITKASLSIPTGVFNVKMCTPVIEARLEEGDLSNAIDCHVSDKKRTRKGYNKVFNSKVEIKALPKTQASSLKTQPESEFFVEENREEDTRSLVLVAAVYENQKEVETMPVERGVTLVKKEVDEFERRVYEGEIRSRVDVSEDEETTSENRIIKKKIITTTYFRFVSEKFFKNREEIVTSERIEDLCKEVEEIYLSMPADSSVEEFEEDLRAETIVKQCEDEFSDENLPVKRKTIWMNLRGATDKLSTCNDDKTLIKRVEGDMISSTSVAECSSLLENGSRSVCKKSTTRFFRPVGLITLSRGVITDAVILEETSHYDIIEHVTTLASDVTGPEDSAAASTNSEEVFNEKTSEDIPVVKTVLMTKVFRRQNEVLEMQEAEEVEEDQPIEVVQELIGGVVYKNLVINEKEISSFAKTKSIFPKLFLKQIELDTCFKVYNSGSEESPAVRTIVQESVDVLPDGTRVKRRLTKTVQKKSVVKRLAYDDSCQDELQKGDDVLEKVKGECFNTEADEDLEEKKDFSEEKESDKKIGKMFKRYKKQKYVTETKFVLSSVANNGVDDFYGTF